MSIRIKQSRILSVMTAFLYLCAALMLFFTLDIEEHGSIQQGRTKLPPLPVTLPAGPDVPELDGGLY